MNKATQSGERQVTLCILRPGTVRINSWKSRPEKFAPWPDAARLMVTVVPNARNNTVAVVPALMFGFAEWGSRSAFTSTQVTDERVRLSGQTSRSARQSINVCVDRKKTVYITGVQYET